MKPRSPEPSGTTAKPPTAKSVAENLEWIVLAIILQFLVRCFVIEPFQIPTGSMAPTIMGNHRVIECENCGYLIEVGHGVDFQGRPVASSHARCPICGYETSVGPEDGSVFDRFMERIMLGSVVRGDRILVNKFEYDLRKPRRWEVFVFIEPNSSSDKKNFIKRLVGLPGDRLNIRGGDIYVNGELARKPKEVQRGLWQLVYDSSRSFKNKRSFWSKSPGSWREIDDFLELPSPAGFARAVFNKRGGIRDFSAYNSGRSSRCGRFAVPDVRFAADLEPLSETGSLTIRFESDRKRIELTLAFDKNPRTSSLSLEYLGRDGPRHREVLPVEVGRLVKGESRRLDFWYADHTATVFMDGREVFSYEETDIRLRDASPEPPTASGIVLELSNAAARLADIQIYRDIYYTDNVNPRWLSAEGDIVVPKGHYFAMGDNSPHSNDSRAWGPVPENNLLGHALFVWWPIQRWKAIR